jgi:FkbM family methyltransferase
MDKDYSQHGEQKTITGYLSPCGCSDGGRRLLDIGAWVPDTFSNTRALLDAGWSGVLVEPSPGPFTALLDHYRENSRVILVNAVVATHDGWCRFWDSRGDAISSIDLDHVSRWREGFKVPYRDFRTMGVSPATLIGQVGTDFEFVNIDAEAVSAAIFMLMPWHLLNKCRCICVEHDNVITDLVNKAGTYGFKVLDQNGENLIFGR